VRARALAIVVICVLAAAATAEPAHTRVRTPRGPIHVWTPVGYDAASADLVIYVHGYFVTVDEAWRRHRLAAQFARAELPAMFVVCGAPSAHVDPIDWESLDDLIAALPEPPRGRVIVVAHSGGIRTVRAWLGSPRLDALVLLDAMYGPLPEAVAWLGGDPARRLIDVSELTRPWADELHASLPETVTVDALPSLDEARDTRVMHVRSQLGHTELVTGGQAIPALLRLFAR
jgi:hypothetical protein